jgi:hypothetical protein
MERSAKIRERLFECIHNGEIEDEDLAKITEHCCKILNLQTISNFSKSENISYNGVKYKKNGRVFIDGCEFIINNY